MAKRRSSSQQIFPYDFHENGRVGRISKWADKFATSFKFRGKRVFKMAPIHHHFEHLGWHESKVIIRFWIAGLVLALFALTTLKLR